VKTKTKTLFVTISLCLCLLSACVFINQNDTLDGTAWLLTLIDNIPPLSGTRLTVEFSSQLVDGSSGCNSYGGSYDIKGEKIFINQIAMTEMACLDPGVMEQEQTFIKYLQDAQNFALSEGYLLIFRSDGKALTFVPQD